MGSKLTQTRQQPYTKEHLQKHTSKGVHKQHLPCVGHSRPETHRSRDAVTPTFLLTLIMPEKDTEQYTMSTPSLVSILTRLTSEKKIKKEYIPNSVGHDIKLAGLFYKWTTDPRIQLFHKHANISRWLTWKHNEQNFYSFHTKIDLDHDRTKLTQLPIALEMLPINSNIVKQPMTQKLWISTKTL